MSAATDLFGFVPAHDPGGQRIPLPAGVTATAIYGGKEDCRRYWLEWVWNERLPTLAVGMMNPSCAGHLCGDRTVCWVHRWAARRGFGRLIVVNASSYRAADQSRLAAAGADPENDTYILRAGREAAKVVLGYGQPKVRGAWENGPRMVRLLVSAGVPLHVWALSIDGTPKHPLYLPASTEASLWRPAAGLLVAP